MSKSTFLNGDSFEEVCMQPPFGHVHSSDKACRVCHDSSRLFGLSNSAL